jgi:hypothetical protein
VELLLCVWLLHLHTGIIAISSMLTTKCVTQSPLVELGQVASLVIACNSHLQFKPECGKNFAGAFLKKFHMGMLVIQLLV